MAVDIIIGLQRGDEGKGRFVDLIAGSYSIVARGNGGANAGHTIMPSPTSSFALHQIPSGIVYPNIQNVIGGGVYVDPTKLRREIEELTSLGIKFTPKRLVISNTAHLVMPHHILLDEKREAGNLAQGSTKAGIAFVASDKYLRHGVRVELISDPKQLYDRAYDGLKNVLGSSKSDATITKIAEAWLADVEFLMPFITDTVHLVNEQIKDGRNVLIEGAQAYGLDIDHGMYPYVTSSLTTVAGLLSGLGVAHRHVTKVTGVVKVIKSHVGMGPFVTEITEEKLASRIRGKSGAIDSEYGTTTKRPRRIGYPDLPELRSAIQVNGVDELAITKMDHVERFGKTFNVATDYVLADGSTKSYAPSSALDLMGCRPVYTAMDTWQAISTVRDFSKLPKEAKEFIDLLENELSISVSHIGVGPEREQVISKV